MIRWSRSTLYAFVLAPTVVGGIGESVAVEVTAERSEGGAIARGAKPDPHPSQIFIVDGAPRKETFSDHD